MQQFLAPIYLPLTLTIMFANPARLLGQSTIPDQMPPASSSTGMSPQVPGSPAGSQPTVSPDRPVSWKLLTPNLL